VRVCCAECRAVCGSRVLFNLSPFSGRPAQAGRYILQIVAPPVLSLSQVTPQWTLARDTARIIQKRSHQQEGSQYQFCPRVFCLCERRRQPPASEASSPQSNFETAAAVLNVECARFIRGRKFNQKLFPLQLKQSFTGKALWLYS
jgi:hypothetical protein